MGLGPTELVIVLAIVVLLFGARKLPDLGRSIKEFRNAMGEDDEGGAEATPDATSNDKEV